jgi:hypothetical protein
VPNQSPVDMCPLPEQPFIDLRRDVTSGDDGASGHLAPARPPLPTRTEPPAALLRSDLHHPIETRFKLTWIMVKRQSFIREVRLRIIPSSCIPIMLISRVECPQCTCMMRLLKGFREVSLDSEGEDEDWDVADSSRDEEIACKLFDLNHDLLGPPDDGTIIIISDSEEEEHEDGHVSTNAASSSLRVPPAPSTTDDNGTSDRVQHDSSGSGSKDEAGTP